MDKTHIINQLKDFYLQSYELYQRADSVGLRRLYLDTCKELEQSIAVHYFGLQYFRKLASTFDRLIVVANHITTPSHFAIDDEEFINHLGIDKELLAWKQIQPLVIRHYPLVQMLIAFEYDPVVISGEGATILSEFARGWGNILISSDAGDRLKLLRDEIKYHSSKRLAVIIFPEGQDSPDYLPKDYYRLAEFKSGFAVLAHDFALPVVPVSLTYNMNTFEYTTRVNQSILPSVFSDIEDVRALAMERVIDGIRFNLR